MQNTASPYECSQEPLLSVSQHTLGADAATDLAPLVAACFEATFGKGSQEVRTCSSPPLYDGLLCYAMLCLMSILLPLLQVRDPEYRSAKVLHASSFFTDFRLEQHSILSEIAAIACPNASALTAQLDKLNVYSQGDFFRPHIDTPHGDTMVGSLVVCLPCPHQGGALSISHAGRCAFWMFFMLLLHPG